MTRNILFTAMLAIASTSLAQSTQPGQTTPSVTPPSGAPVVGGSEPAPVVEQRSIGGMSKCENALAFEKEKCLQDERAAATGSSSRPAGTGVSPAPSGTGTGAGTMAPQNTAPAGSVR